MEEESGELVRLTIRYPKELDERIIKYMKLHVEITNKTEAIRRLIAKGLREEGIQGEINAEN